MKKTKVFLIDDDIVLGYTLMPQLQEAGMDVHYQTSLSGCEAAIQSWQPDIILLDVEIGDSNGIDAMSQIQLIAPDVPVIFISSHLENEYEKQAIRHGGKRYVRKPIDFELLKTYIEMDTKQTEETSRFGTLTVDWNRQEITFTDGSITKVPAMEIRLLKLLIANANQLVTRQQIEEALWEKGNRGSSEQSLNNYVARLRKTLAKDTAIVLKTIPRTGYQLTITTTHSS